VVVVLDPSLLGKVGVIEGVRDRAVVVVNAHASPQNLKQLFPGTHHTLCTIDGTAIALQLLGRNLPNVPVLGALLRVVPIVDLEQAKQALRERFQVRFPESVVEGNLRALMRGFEEASVEGDS
jgi:pyruvate ferredoxin oxidoreductase gamma subunit